MTDIKEAMEYYKRKRDKEFESKCFPVRSAVAREK